MGRFSLAAALIAQIVLADGIAAQSSALANGIDTTSTPFEIIIETEARLLVVLRNGDTLMQAPIGVATGQSFSYGEHTWRYIMPPGERRVRRKIADPVWVPPDWHYAETARNHDLKLVRLPLSGFTLSGGARLAVLNERVGIVYPDGAIAELPIDEHIVFDGKLFIPPLGTLNRRVTGNLGSYALDLGGGFLIHGTTNQASIGEASTHGCIRIGDDDLRWLYDNIPLGARVLVR
jgi:lipoprotein-anchoring transpeptidase ErfK/SrfK